jgi:signal transduction histidine kinase
MVRVVLVTKNSATMLAMVEPLQRQAHTVVAGASWQFVGAATNRGAFDVLVVMLDAKDPKGTEVVLQLARAVRGTAVVLLIVPQKVVLPPEAADVVLTLAAEDLPPATLLYRIEQACKLATAQQERDRSARMRESLLARLSAAHGLATHAHNAVRDASGKVHRALGHVAEELGMRQEDLLERIDANIGRVEMLLAKASGYAEPVVVATHELPLQELLDAAVAELRAGLAESAKLDVHVACGDVQPPWHGDRTALLTVLSELLRNAAAATKQRGRIDIAAWATDTDHGIDVSDDGPGIERERREEIWLPFQHALHGGVGIGLAMCRKILAAHQGELVLMPSTRRGARFRIRFPRKVGAAAGHG